MLVSFSQYFYAPSLFDTVGEDIMFSAVHPLRSFVRSPGQILLPLYLMNGLSNLR